MHPFAILYILSLYLYGVTLAAPIPDFIDSSTRLTSRELYGDKVADLHQRIQGRAVKKTDNTGLNVPASHTKVLSGKAARTTASIKPVSATAAKAIRKSSSAAIKSSTDTPPDPKNNSAKKSKSQVLRQNAATNSIKNNTPSTATGKVVGKAPTRSKAAVGDVMQSVTNWIADVDTVNRFLNDALSLPVGPTLKTAAQKALTYAQDEPTNLKLLKATPGIDADGLAAAEVLENVFGDVLKKLTDVVNSPANLAVAVDSVADINDNRCKNVLPSAETLWRSAAVAANMATATWPPRANVEDACSAIRN